MSSSFLWLAELLCVTILPETVGSKKSPWSSGQARCVFDGAQQVCFWWCSRGAGPWLSLAVAPTLQPQHLAGTAGTPGLLRASHRPGPAALHSSRVGPWGAVITSCQQPHGAPHPQSSQTGTCSRLSLQNSLVLLSVSAPASQHTCMRDAPVPMSIFLRGQAEEQDPT